MIGVPSYMAPEILNEYYNKKVDIWGLGVLMYELLSRKQPFEASCDQDLMILIKRG
jgi:serine/threonine protein kinase